MTRIGKYNGYGRLLAAYHGRTVNNISYWLYRGEDIEFRNWIYQRID